MYKINFKGLFGFKYLANQVMKMFKKKIYNQFSLPLLINYELKITNIIIILNNTLFNKLIDFFSHNIFII